MSTPPQWRSTWSNAAATAPSSVTSMCTGNARAGAADAAAASFAPASSTSQKATAAPASTNPCAMPQPKPEAAPVTIATLPARTFCGGAQERRTIVFRLPVDDESGGSRSKVVGAATSGRQMGYPRRGHGQRLRRIQLLRIVGQRERFPRLRTTATRGGAFSTRAAFSFAGNSSRDSARIARAPV